MSPQPTPSDADNEVVLRALFENCHLACALLDIDGSIRRINTAAVQQMQRHFRRAPQPGDSIDEFIPPAQRTAFAADFERALAGEPVVTENVLTDAGGRTYYYEMRCQPIAPAQGPVRGVCILWTDISQHRYTEHRLSQSEARYRSIVDSQTEMVCRFLPDTTLTFINDAYCRYFGLGYTDLLGKRFLELLPEEAHEGVLQHIHGLKQQDAPVIYEHQAFSASGELRWQQWVDRPIFDEHGQLIEIQSVGWDITELKRAQQELASARDAAEAASRAKSMFLANMSHELRTPLNAVLGFAQLLDRDTALDAEQRKYLQLIMHNGDQLLALINDLLEVSQIETGQQILHTEDFDLYAMLDELEREFLPPAQDKLLSLQFERTHDLPRYLRTDQRKLQQVMASLLSNAVKFTREGGIYVLARPDQEATLPAGQARLVFEVRDTGIGMTQEEQQQIFLLFTQMHGDPGLPGMGLGLALCREFVYMMGGSIHVSSEKGRGSIFAFDIIVEVVSSSDTARPLLPPAPPEQGILPGELAALPPALLEQLKLAATDLDIVACQQVAERIDGHNSKLGQMLQDWIDQFRFDKILDALRLMEDTK